MDQVAKGVQKHPVSSSREYLTRSVKNGKRVCGRMEIEGHGPEVQRVAPCHGGGGSPSQKGSSTAQESSPSDPSHQPPSRHSSELRLALRRGVSTGQLKIDRMQSDQHAPVAAGSSYYTRVAQLFSRSPSQGMSPLARSTSPMVAMIATSSLNDPRYPRFGSKGSASDSLASGPPLSLSPLVRNPSRTYLQRIKDKSSSPTSRHKSPSHKATGMGVGVGVRGVEMEEWVMRGAPSNIDIACMIGWKATPHSLGSVDVPHLNHISISNTALQRTQTESVLEGIRGRRSGGKWDKKPLLLAAKEGRLDDVAALLEGAEGDSNLGEEGGSDIFTRDREGMTALHHASWAGRLPVVKFLVERGGKDLWMARDKMGNTALHYASWKNHPATVKFLCEHGGKDLIVAVDVRGKSCLDVSRTLRLFDIVDFLYGTGYFKQ